MSWDRQNAAPKYHRQNSAYDWRRLNVAPSFVDLSDRFKRQGASASLSPDPLVDFDFSAPLSSWKTGFTGFASAYATDEWLLQETSGTYANTGTGSATLANSGGLMGQTAVGIWDGTGYTNRKAWESTQVSDYAQASTTTAADFDEQDFCFRIVYRFANPYGVAYGNLANKMTPSTGGWRFRLAGATGLTPQFQIHDGTNYFAVAATSEQVCDGALHYFTAWWDSSADMLYCKTDQGGTDSISTATRVAGFTINLALKLMGWAGGQICYAGTCLGANAQAMYDEDFWQHAEDPTGLLTTATRACLISVPVAAGYVGHFSDDQLPIGYHSAFSDADKLGLYCNSAQTNYMEESEDFSTWTNTNTTDTAASGDAPDGFRTATDLTASADNGYISRNTAALSATTPYTFSVWVKRVGGSDVTGKIRLRDDNAATETDQAFTATATWQRVQVSHTMGATPTGQNYIFVDTNTEAILVWGAQTEVGSGAGAYIRTSGASASLVHPNYERATEDCIASAEGEILVNFVWTIWTDNSQSHLYEQAHSAIAENRKMLLSASQRFTFTMNQDANVEDSGIFTATHDPVPKDQEVTLAWQWGASLVTPENRFIVDGNNEDSANSQPYEFSAASAYEGLQVGSSRSATAGLDGFIQRIVTYDQLVTEGV